MVLFRARSIRQLTIIGFFAVAALLIAALLVTARQLDSLSEQGQLAVGATASAMSASRQLIDQTLDMERNALQYVILGEDSLYQVYTNRRAEFQAAADRLSALNHSGLAAEVQTLVISLLNTEEMAFAQLSASPDRDSIEAAYARLSRMAHDLSFAIEIWVAGQQSQLRELSDTTRQTLSLQAVLFIISAFALAAFFILLITHPLKQIDTAINQLGSGDYQDSIKVGGPRDLRALGLRLDWLRNRLGELEQQRASFLRHVSHELKTPLASMQEGASLLNDEVVGPLNSEQKDISRIIVSNSQRLQNLIEDLLRHNAQNFEVLNAMPQPVRFDKVIDRVIGSHQWPIRSRRIRVQKTLERLTVLTDPERLRVVIDNLFTNALKFSPEDGVITLRLAGREGLAVFEIADQGPGIPAAEWSKVFQAFYQGSVQPRRAANGTGLGLAIAREYVLASGGNIELCNADSVIHGTHSDAGKTGACFRVSIPLPPKTTRGNAHHKEIHNKEEGKN